MYHHMSRPGASGSSAEGGRGTNRERILDRTGFDEGDLVARARLAGLPSVDERRTERVADLFAAVEVAEVGLVDRPESDAARPAWLREATGAIEPIRRRSVDRLEAAAAAGLGSGYDLEIAADGLRDGREVGEAGVRAATLVGAQSRLQAEVIDAVFDRLLSGLETDAGAPEAVDERVEAARADLLAATGAVNLDLQVALEGLASAQTGDVWRDALDEMLDPVIVIDEDEEIVVFNDAMEELTGVRETEAHDMALWEIFRTRETHGTTTTAIERVLETEEPIRELEIEFLNHHDERLTTVVSNAPIYDDGDLVGAVSVIRDVTEDRERERALAETHQQVTSEIEALATDQAEMAADIAETMADVEERAAEQVEMADEMQAELQDESASMEEVAASADEIAATAQEARDLVESGLEASAEAEETMDVVVETADDLVETATELTEWMDEIDDIVDVIGDVADQTNLLALNANIEAAHAGEEGDGFAVVANEVQSLANETKDHTSEIRSLIEDVQSQTTRTVEASEETSSRVGSASDDIGDVFDAFEDIARAVDEVAGGIDEIATANDERVRRLEDVVSMAEEFTEHAESALTAAKATGTLTDGQLESAERIVDEVESLAEEMESVT